MDGAFAAEISLTTISTIVLNTARQLDSALEVRRQDNLEQVARQAPYFTEVMT
ncbi:hypothetical protein ACI48D_04775 [Massilia sp. LXY-6]|uniref:hypothetical protein n=1 Tax=Massilia sp. LXY-6 TaxID=3379823 RepID=UPI003EE10C7F